MKRLLTNHLLRIGIFFMLFIIFILTLFCFEFQRSFWSQVAYLENYHPTDLVTTGVHMQQQSYKTVKTQQILSEKYSLLQHNPSQNGSVLRILLEQSSNSQKKDQMLNKDLLLLVIVIICIVVFALGIVICVICIRTRTFTAVDNSRKKTLYLSTQQGIQYQLFVDCFGEPYQTNCVICLQDYEYKSSNKLNVESNKREQQKNAHKNTRMTNNLVFSRRNSNRIHNSSLQQDQNDRNNGRFQQITNNQSPLSAEHQNNPKTMKLTVCGHLIHSICIQKWLERQQNCPLCRQAFTQQNLKTWQQNIGIKILQRPERSLHSQNQQQDIISVGSHLMTSSQISSQNENTNQRRAFMTNTIQTLNQISRNNQKNETQQNLQQTADIYSMMVIKIQRNAKSNSIKQLLYIYAKIMAYHYKKSKLKQQNILFFQQLQEEDTRNNIMLSQYRIEQKTSNYRRANSMNFQLSYLQAQNNNNNYNRPKKRKRTKMKRQASTRDIQQYQQ